MTNQYAELIRARQEIENRIARLNEELRVAKEAEVKAVVQKVKELMNQHGLTVDDLMKTGARVVTTEVRKVAPKYRNPSSGETWTGRGLKPKWLIAALQTGKTVQDFLIQQ